jgi:hypothetical protein
LPLEQSLRRAIANVADHGDTDIFPYPLENRIVFDKADDVVAYLLKADADFETFISELPPTTYGTLAPVGYTGFRWATQIDPLWNILFLAHVIELGPKIEAARLPVDAQRVFSYRFNDDANSSDVFKKKVGWRQFMERALQLAEDHAFIVSCDVSEFYPRLNHHRLENALLRLPSADDDRKKIMAILTQFSEGYSFGLPVGGPASRLLSELTLNQIDRLLQQKGASFCRFADDYFLFAESRADAFKKQVFQSGILQGKQGHQLQKSKTRIMSAAEFKSTNPLTGDPGDTGEDEKITKGRKQIFTISLHFDPYSPTAQADYTKLSNEVGKFPILDILRAELTKSRINIALTRRLIRVLRYISDTEIGDAVKTLIENEDVLYPVYFNVLSAVKSVFSKLGPEVQKFVSEHVASLINDGHPVMAVDLNLQYAVRLLGELNTEEATAVLVRVFDETSSEPIRSDIILVMSKWNNWAWLSDRRRYFRSVSPAQRRSLIVASYFLSDEGRHWRKRTAGEFSPLEQFTREWMSNRVSQPGWEMPI